MEIKLNGSFQASYNGNSLIIDNARNEEIKFREQGEWDVFEEIIGFPSQFNSNADPIKKKSGKTSNTYGRVFSSTIISDNNIVFFEPGKPKFMDSNWFDSAKSKEKAQAVLKDLAGDTASGTQSIFENKGFKLDSRYYSFESSFVEYMRFVNSMATYLAVKLGIADRKDDLKLMAISRGGNNFSKSTIPFYFDAGSTKFSEGGSTSTGESMIFGKLKTAGSLMREADFLLNGKATEDNILAEARDYLSENLSKAFEKFGNVGDAVSNIIGASNMSLKGANLMFPQIWQDSSYRQSITVGFKFSSPYGDKVSIYNNVLFPIICLLALALPRQVGRQGYTAPFLLKVYCKGWFNCDLGMIESIEVDKGPGNAWSSDALPLEATVNVTIKDLYSSLMMTAGSGGHLMTNNTGLVEYLETMAGLSITNPDIFANFNHKLQESLWSISNKINEIAAGAELSTIGKILGGGEEFLKAGLDFIDGLFYDEDEEGDVGPEPGED